MNFTDPNPKNSQVVAINWIDRWEAYYRLKELQIPCQCSPNQPLEVQLSDATMAIQLWSVIRQLTSTRRELVDWLNQCWCLEIE